MAGGLESLRRAKRRQGGRTKLAQETVECDPLFRTAERFSSLKVCQGSPFGRPPEAARYARPGQTFRDEKNGVHANNGAIANAASRSSPVEALKEVLLVGCVSRLKGFSDVMPADAGIQTEPHAGRWPSLDARIRGHDKILIPINFDDAACESQPCGKMMELKP